MSYSYNKRKKKRKKKKRKIEKLLRRKFVKEVTQDVGTERQ